MTELIQFRCGPHTTNTGESKPAAIAVAVMCTDGNPRTIVLREITPML
jgi:hypothetical protein